MASSGIPLGGASQLQTIDETISIEDLRNRKYKLEDLTTELQLLKNKISTLRYEMISMMRLLATLNEDTEGKTLQDCFNELQAKVVTLKEDIDSYIDRYRKIAPVVAYAKKELGKTETPINNIVKQVVKVDTPIFASNQVLVQGQDFNGATGHNQQLALLGNVAGVATLGAGVANTGSNNISSTSTRGGRGGSKRGSTARKPRGRGGNMALRQNSRGGPKSGPSSQGGAGAGDYLGATASEPILL